MSSKRLYLTAVALTPLLGLLGCQTPGRSSADGTKTIKIGVSASFSGATAFYGQEAKAGVQVAVDELNAKGGAYKYEVVTADDECTPDGGASAFGNLIDVQRVDVIIGSPCSGAELSGMALLPASKVPGLVVSATNPAITEQAGTGGNAYVWRLNIGDDVMAKVFAKSIADKGIKKVALIAVNNDFGRGGVGAFKKSFADNGVTVTTEQYYTQGGGDFRPQLTNIKASGAEAMLIVGAHQDAAVMMRQYKELGLGFKVFARGDVVSTAFQESAGDANLGNGIEEANNWDSTYSLYPDFAKAYRDKFGRDAQSTAVQAWLGVQAIAQAVAASGGGRDGIESGLSKVDWKSPIGPVKFDDHHQAHHDMFILGFVDGKIKLIQRTPTAG